MPSSSFVTILKCELARIEIIAAPHLIGFPSLCHYRPPFHSAAVDIYAIGMHRSGIHVIIHAFGGESCLIIYSNIAVVADKPAAFGKITMGSRAVGGAVGAVLHQGGGIGPEKESALKTSRVWPVR